MPDYVSDRLVVPLATFRTFYNIGIIESKNDRPQNEWQFTPTKNHSNPDNPARPEKSWEETFSLDPLAEPFLYLVGIGHSPKLAANQLRIKDSHKASLVRSLKIYGLLHLDKQRTSLTMSLDQLAARTPPNELAESLESVKSENNLGVLESTALAVITRSQVPGNDYLSCTIDARFLTENLKISVEEAGGILTDLAEKDFIVNSDLEDGSLSYKSNLTPNQLEELMLGELQEGSWGTKLIERSKLVTKNYLDALRDTKQFSTDFDDEIKELEESQLKESQKDTPSRVTLLKICNDLVNLREQRWEELSKNEDFQEIEQAFKADALPFFREEGFSVESLSKLHVPSQIAETALSSSS